MESTIFQEVESARNSGRVKSSYSKQMWSINDRSIVDFMAEFYGKIRHKGRAESFIATQLSFIDSPEHYHPFYWAPFVVVGER